MTTTNRHFRRTPRLVPAEQRAPLYAAYKAAREWAEKNGESYTDDGIIQAAVRAFDAERRAQGQAVIDYAHLVRQRAFSEGTFGPGPRTEGVLDHIRKELAEIEAAPDDLSEWVDVVILALDGAWRAGHEPQQIIDAIVAKQAKNEARVWPDWRTAKPGQAIEHDRTAD
ncbi:DUF550 domain-containing protein [Micromonospora zamorensis]|uniref:dATP/dGTP pyrophosphohydrolase domain-containing protein n=1 Tax=Micromonospora zamorensis TaxID=709883 RepID=UPI00352BC2F9|nr:DUF550 domain-containing protein [Micromonospora zamorensis]